VASTNYTYRLRRRVFLRDEYRCRLCGGEIPPLISKDAYQETIRVHGQVPANAGTMDHIIPVSHGGPRSMWNLRAAHQLCNVRRANVVDPLMDYRHLVENGAFGDRHARQMPGSLRWPNVRIINYLIQEGYPL
jgi:5-methylcytosine-specific restriction endonuclease McrA